VKNKMRGKNKIGKKLRRKQKNVVDAQSVKLRDMQKTQREARESVKSGEAAANTKESLGALARFAKKV
jgi:hypothetical protein